MPVQGPCECKIFGKQLAMLVKVKMPCLWGPVILILGINSWETLAYGHKETPLQGPSRQQCA